jgi:hypothetical protein
VARPGTARSTEAEDVQEYLYNHQNWVIAILGFAMWIAAYVWYFWKDIRRAWNRDKPGRWYADMSIRKADKRLKPPRPNANR